jgi:AhpD family alkylhydroperoxidase
MQGRGFHDFNETTAASSARERLAKVRALFGAIPTPVARHAGSPPLLAQALDGLAAFESSSLAPMEREVVAMVVANRHGCGFCISLHRGILAGIESDKARADAVACDAPTGDARLDALRDFTHAVFDTHGDVPAETFSAFLAQGFTHQSALDVVLGVGVYTLTTFANRLVEAGPFGAPAGA